MNTSYTPNTPPRRVGHRSRLTPSTTPFITPTKTESRYELNSLLTSNHTRRSVRSPYAGSYSQSGIRTPSRYLTTSKSNRSTPFYTAHQSPSAIECKDDDRFIPSRKNMNLDLCRRVLLTGEKRQHSFTDDATNTNTSQTTSSSATQETPLQKEFKRRMLSTLCNIPLDKLDDDARPTGMFAYGNRSNKNIMSTENIPPPTYRLQDRNSIVNPFSIDILRTMKLGENANNDPSFAGLAAVASKALRKVPSAPVRILDAPDIVDDYYLNLISWSKDNILAVALARSVYLWNAATGDINHLITVQGVDYITSVSWCTQPGQTKHIAIGTHLNHVHIFDGQTLSKVRQMDGAAGRIASLSWNSHHGFLSAGDRDACIINHDMRVDTHIISKYRGHLQEVCGLKWNDDGSCLASGGNENYLCLWDVAMSNRSSNRNNRSTNTTDIASDLEHNPRLILKHHKAAVKALDWCPFHRGLLASGGGTADRSIKFWNSSSGVMLNTIDTGSQVCSILWSKHHKELCSSHGYSENQLILWKYPAMTKIKELTGHTARVLNMDMSPDGTSVVSAGADETLRFWNLFETQSSSQKNAGGMHLGELSFGVPTIR